MKLRITEPLDLPAALRARVPSMSTHPYFHLPVHLSVWRTVPDVKPQRPARSWRPLSKSARTQGPTRLPQRSAVPLSVPVS